MKKNTSLQVNTDFFRSKFTSLLANTARKCELDLFKEMIDNQKRVSTQPYSLSSNTIFLFFRRRVTLDLLEVDQYMLGILTSLERYVSVACECRLTILLNNLAV